VLRALTAPASAHAALRSAAGGGGSGGGFSALTSYLDKIATYLVPVGGALAVVGLIYGGSLLMTGSPYAGRTLAYVVIGVVIVLASKGIAA
jgi:type IV secretory pathway VirB2 component (pilin)